MPLVLGLPGLHLSGSRAAAQFQEGGGKAAAPGEDSPVGLEEGPCGAGQVDARTLLGLRFKLVTSS